MPKKRPSKKAMAARVWRIRRRLGWSQKEFAARLGVAERTFQYWEAGVTLPRARDREALERLAKRRRIPW